MFSLPKTFRNIQTTQSQRHRFSYRVLRSNNKIARHPVQMSVQGAARLFSPVSYGIGAILPLEVFQQEAFFIFTVFADTPSADKVFISFNLENRPSATVVISCVEAVAHILPQPLEQPFFSIRLTYVENIGGGNALCLQTFDRIGGTGVIVNGTLESNRHPGWDANAVDSFFAGTRRGSSKSFCLQKSSHSSASVASPIAISPLIYLNQICRILDYTHDAPRRYSWCIGTRPQNDKRLHRARPYSWRR